MAESGAGQGVDIRLAAGLILPMLAAALEQLAIGDCVRLVDQSPQAPRGIAAGRVEIAPLVEHAAQMDHERERFTM
jgi:hypothetical protein